MDEQDQANGLRKSAQRCAPTILSVTGGKGGVGKTSVSLNLGVALAQQGHKVMIFDADLGLANVDVMLGIQTTRNLSHVLAEQCELADIVVEGPFGVQIIPAASGTQGMVTLSSAQYSRLIYGFQALNQDIDFLIVDTAAGISDMVLSFARTSQEVLVVLCDEPTSITDAYALIKLLNREHGVQRFQILPNMVLSYREGRSLFQKLTRVTKRFLNAELSLLACVPRDDHLRQAIRQQQVVVAGYPSAPSSLAFSALAKKVAAWPCALSDGKNVSDVMEKALQHQTILENEEASLE